MADAAEPPATAVAVPDPPAGRAVGFEVVAEELLGAGGFLAVRRRRLHNVRPDGSRSRLWTCDYIERHHGLDAVVLALWRRPSGAAGGETVEVLLREGLRPALAWGRPAERSALPEEAAARLFFTETVAGIIEEGEQGEEAVRRRAAAEAAEEAGIAIAPEGVVLLGTGFPSPGMTPERYVFAAAEVPAGAPACAPPGDGSPMEEGARVFWVGLAEALDLVRRGVIEDLKTEVVLRRLADHLGHLGHLGPSR